MLNAEREDHLVMTMTMTISNHLPKNQNQMVRSDSIGCVKKTLFRDRKLATSN